MTLISHDSEEAQPETGYCLAPGCYTHSITYAVPYKQIEALAEISDNCQQKFKVISVTMNFK